MAAFLGFVSGTRCMCERSEWTLGSGGRVRSATCAVWPEAPCPCLSAAQRRLGDAIHLQGCVWGWCPLSWTWLRPLEFCPPSLLWGSPGCLLARREDPGVGGCSTPGSVHARAHTLDQLWGPCPMPSLLPGPPVGGDCVLQWSGLSPWPFCCFAIWWLRGHAG